jgi:hypothetical protein
MTARGSRRTFLAGAGALGAAGALAGCTVQMDGVWQQAPARPILPSPEGYTAADVLATPRPDTAELETFLTLSSVLTGFDNLDPVLGAVYLSSLRAREDAPATLPALYETAGFGAPNPPLTVEDLEAAGVFAQESLAALADTIITYWYTGIYDTAEGPRVATYVDALAWQAIEYTKPRTICGPFPGFWRERPPVVP